MSVQTEARRAPQQHPGQAPIGSPAAPPKLRRQPALVLAAVILVTAGGVVAAWVATAVGSTVPVVAVRGDVARGEVITADDLTSVRISVDPALATIPADDAGSLVGLRAARDLSAGALLTPASVTDLDIPVVGESVVGIEVSPGQLPGQALRPGDAVRVVATPRQGDDPPLESPAAVAATVVAVRTVAESGAVVVDVTVPQHQAASLVAVAATGRVALVLDGVSTPWH